MNLFLSWSGSLSHEVAKALVWWVPQVIQAVRPWISSQDIEKGSRWFEEIGESLSNTDFGILCLTASNITAPWILFEAGALSKSLGQARVCPLLVNIKNADLQGPLAQFNTSGIGRDEIRKLVDALNARLSPELRRPESQLEEAFDVWWPRLDAKIKEAISSASESEDVKRTMPKRKAEDVLDEILELSRVTVQQLFRVGITTVRPSGVDHVSKYPSGTVGAFAVELRKQPEVLLEQLKLAGVIKFGAEDPLTEDDKHKLLAYLQRQHYGPSEDRKKITIVKKRK